MNFPTTDCAVMGNQYIILYIIGVWTKQHAKKRMSFRPNMRSASIFRELSVFNGGFERAGPLSQTPYSIH